MTEDFTFTDHRVDNNIFRLNALVYFTLLIIIFLTNCYWLSLILCIDLGLKGFEIKHLGLFGKILKRILNFYKKRRKLTNAGPKVFSANLGFIFSSAIIFAYILNLNYLRLIFLLLLIMCTFLEAFFDFCVGCYIYKRIS
jgi:hypothetical protein